MGACNFTSVARRGGYTTGELVRQGNVYSAQYTDWPDAQTAFERLTEECRYENGHSYSGGIGMKHSFVHIASVATLDEAFALADRLIDEGDPRVDDKWGPAGCITITDPNEKGQFLFFGWAST